MPGAAASAAVLGMACTYTLKDVYPFVKSLRKASFDGTVQLGIDPDAPLRAFLTEHGVLSEADKQQLSIVWYSILYHSIV